LNFMKGGLFCMVCYGEVADEARQRGDG